VCVGVLETKLKLQAIPTRLVCDASNKLSSIINRFPNTHTPLFAYENDKEFAGLLTLHNTLFKQRYNPSTLIRSRLLKPPQLLNNTSISEILQSMGSLKLYTLPIFDDNGKIVGIVKAKPILKNLILKQIFTETMVENVPKRTVVTILEKSTVGDAFQMFSQHALSRLIVVDKNNKIKGVVTKRDILSPYLNPTKHQRFSTRSHQKNYSFDIEQVKRDHQPLMNYVSPILKMFDEKIDTSEAIHNLLDSSYNSIILVSKERKPRFIITMKDVLKTAVKITTKTPYLLTIISNLPQGINPAEKKEVNKKLASIASRINKQQRVQLVRFTTKIVFSPERKPILFITNLKITTDKSSYFAKNKNRDFMESLGGVINQVKKQLRRVN